MRLLNKLAQTLGYHPVRHGYEPWGFGLKEDLNRLGMPASGVRVVLDVGANVGGWAAVAHASFPQAMIHAFEPVPKTYARLSEALSGLPRVETHNLAVSDQSGHVTMHLFDNSEVNSILPTANPFGQAAGTVMVPAQTLDAWCAEHNVSRIDLLKVDVEGHELSVLKGAHASLEAGAIRFLFLETKSVSDAEVVGPGTSLDALAAYLSPLGYRLMLLYTDFVHLPPQPFYSNFNALFGLARPS